MLLPEFIGKIFRCLSDNFKPSDNKVLLLCGCMKVLFCYSLHIHLYEINGFQNMCEKNYRLFFHKIGYCDARIESLKSGWIAPYPTTSTFLCSISSRSCFKSTKSRSVFPRGRLTRISTSLFSLLSPLTYDPKSAAFFTSACLST